MEVAEPSHWPVKERLGRPLVLVVLPWVMLNETEPRWRCPDGGAPMAVPRWRYPDGGLKSPDSFAQTYRRVEATTLRSDGVPMSSEFQTLRLEVEDRVATLTLDDPKRRNAFTLPMVADVEAAFDHMESSDEVGAVVVTGAAPAFCAGADLSHLQGAAREGLRRIYEGFLRVGRSPLPTVAAVNGAAVGAGMNLALVCDLRIAGSRARFDSRFLDLGLHPGGGHTWMLRRLGGAQLATAMVLFGQILDAEAAVRHGLAWEAVDDDQLLDRARAVAARAASAPPPLVEKAKATLEDMAGIHRHPDAVDRELDPQVWSVEQPFFAERLAALKSKIRKKP